MCSSCEKSSRNNGEALYQIVIEQEENIKELMRRTKFLEDNIYALTGVDASNINSIVIRLDKKQDSFEKKLTNDVNSKLKQLDKKTSGICKYLKHKILDMYNGINSKVSLIEGKYMEDEYDI